MTLAMHETCIRREEHHEIARFANRKEICDFVFLLRTIYLRNRRSYKFIDLGNA